MPIARLLSVFAKVKEKSAARKSAGLQGLCPACKYHGELHREKRWTQLSFFGFPFLAKNRRFAAVCPQCKHTVQEASASLVQYVFWAFV